MAPFQGTVTPKKPFEGATGGTLRLENPLAGRSGAVVWFVSSEPWCGTMWVVKLLEPLAIGAGEAPNRVVFGPHETNLGYRRSMSDRHVAYYLRRAAGGAGVIVTEEASVHASDWPYERSPLATDCADGWARIADACHDEGSIVLAALGHAGGQGTSHWSQRELWAPSSVPEVNTRETPKSMEAEDIAAVVEGFAVAARLAVAAGCDGVEVNAGQYSLVRQFLSGLTNHRDDEWGVDRTRLLVEVISAVRGAVGREPIVALRLSCDELAPWAGITPEHAPELVTSIATDPSRVDMLTVVRGSIYSTAATRPDGHTPAGFNLELTRLAREASLAAVEAQGSGRKEGDSPVPLRVVAQGSIVDVAMAELALVDGTADLVEMTRAQISDAELVTKAGRGEIARIRPCTLANQRSQVRDNRNPIVTSAGDPFSGHETEDRATGGTTTDPAEVIVVGAGPAGMEAARVAASRGHDVTLYEASEQLGGMVRTAALNPGFERFGLLADWLESECRLEGVRVVAGYRVSVEEVCGAVGGPGENGGEASDAWEHSDDTEPRSRRHLVIATGAVPGRRAYTTTRAAVVLSAADALADPDGLPAGSVLVWDPIGGPVGVGVAELLVGRGREVHLATPDNVVGNELARSGDLAPANARLQQAGVELHRRSILRSVKKGSAVLEDRFTAQRRNAKATVVIDAGYWLPDETLWRAVTERVAMDPRIGVTRVGDCVAPRTIHDAILEGRRAALSIG